MTEIAFQPDCLFLVIQMLAVVTAEASRRVDMTHIVRMCCPIHLLVVEDGAVVNILQGLNGSADLLCISGIIFGLLVIFFQPVDGFISLGLVLILNRHHFHGLLMDQWDVRIDLPALHGCIDRFLGECEFMCDSVMAGHTIHGLQLALVDRGLVKAGFHIHVFGGGPIIIVHTDVWNILLQLIERIIFDLVGNVPVDAFSQSFPLRAAAGLEDQVDL